MKTSGLHSTLNDPLQHPENHYVALETVTEAELSRANSISPDDRGARRLLLRGDRKLSLCCVWCVSLCACACARSFVKIINSRPRVCVWIMSN